VHECEPPWCSPGEGGCQPCEEARLMHEIKLRVGRTPTTHVVTLSHLVLSCFRWLQFEVAPPREAIKPRFASASKPQPQICDHETSQGRMQPIDVAVHSTSLLRKAGRVGGR
jgi:hypothetical protein